MRGCSRRGGARLAPERVPLLERHQVGADQEHLEPLRVARAAERLERARQHLGGLVGAQPLHLGGPRELQQPQVVLRHRQRASAAPRRRACGGPSSARSRAPRPRRRPRSTRPAWNVPCQTARPGGSAAIAVEALERLEQRRVRLGHARGRDHHRPRRAARARRPGAAPRPARRGSARRPRRPPSPPRPRSRRAAPPRTRPRGPRATSSGRAMRTSCSQGSELAALRRRGQRLEQAHQAVHRAVLDELERRLLEPDEAVLGRERRQHLGQQLRGAGRPRPASPSRCASSRPRSRSSVRMRKARSSASSRSGSRARPSCARTSSRAPACVSSSARLRSATAASGSHCCAAVSRSPSASSVCSARSVSPFRAQARPSR